MDTKMLGAAIALSLLVPTTAFSQPKVNPENPAVPATNSESMGCFMLSPDGKTLDLGLLCSGGGDSNKVSPAAPASTTTNTTVTKPDSTKAVPVMEGNAGNTVIIPPGTTMVVPKNTLGGNTIVIPPGGATMIVPKSGSEQVTPSDSTSD